MKRLFAAFAIIAGSVFVAIPAALADTPSSDTPSSDTPSSDTPSSDTPSSDTPSSDTPAPGAGTDTSGGSSGSEGAATSKAKSAAAPKPAVAPKKVYVCKYVGTPNVDERLKGGKNPISVSINAPKVPDPVVIGVPFPDAQGRSIVIAFVVKGEPAPGVGDCPRGAVDTPVTPEPPTTTRATCDADGTLVLPKTPGITYTVAPKFDGPGKYTVTATADKNFVLVDGAKSKFQVTVAAKLTGSQCAPPKKDVPDDPNGILPNTGGTPLWMLLLGAGLTAAGVVVLRRPQPTPAIPAYRLEM